MLLRHPTANGGVPGRIRTCGPLLRRQPLCPLSYGDGVRRSVYADGRITRQPFERLSAADTRALDAEALGLVALHAE